MRMSLRLSLKQTLQHCQWREHITSEANQGQPLSPSGRCFPVEGNIITVFCWLITYQSIIPWKLMQGDTSGCAKPPVDLKTKVPLWPGQAKTELLFWSQWEVLHNLMYHPVVYKCISYGASEEDRIQHRFYPKCSDTSRCNMHVLSRCMAEWPGFLFIHVIHSPLQPSHDNGLVQLVGFFWPPMSSSIGPCTSATWGWMKG